MAAQRHLQYRKDRLEALLADIGGVAALVCQAFVLAYPEEPEPAFRDAEEACAYIKRIFSPLADAWADLCGRNGIPVDGPRLLSFARTMFARYPLHRQRRMARRIFAATNGCALRVEAGLLGCLLESDVEAGRFAADIGALRAIANPVAVEILLATLFGRHFFGYACGVRDRERLNIEEAENTLALFDAIEQQGYNPTPFFQALYKTLRAIRAPDPAASFSYLDCLQANIVKKRYAVPSLIGGRYKPLAILGEGGMGIVFLAQNEETGAKAAIKITKGEEEDLVRFIREVRLIKDVNHPYVIGIESFNAYGESGNRHAYYAMRHCPWPSLDELLDPAIGKADEQAGPPSLWRKNQGKLSMADYLDVVVRVLQGIEALHRLDLIHRDIKPENIKYDRQTGTPIIMDFGLVKNLAGDESTLLTQTGRASPTDSVSAEASLGRTSAGMMMGTPGYMAPEQIEDAASVDERADVFSVGVMLYEMLTGQGPFDGKDMFDTVNRTLTHAPAVPSSLNPAIDCALEAIVLKSLDKNPNDRYPSAAAMRGALESYLARVKRQTANMAVAGSGPEAKRVLVVPRKGLRLPPRSADGLASGPAKTAGNVPPGARGRRGLPWAIAASLATVLVPLVLIGMCARRRPAGRTQPGHSALASAGGAGPTHALFPWQGVWSDGALAGRSFLQAASAFDTRRNRYLVADSAFALSAYSAGNDRWETVATVASGAADYRRNLDANLVYCARTDRLLFVGASGAYVFGMDNARWRQADPSGHASPALRAGAQAVFLLSVTAEPLAVRFLQFDFRAGAWRNAERPETATAPAPLNPPGDALAYDSRRRRFLLTVPLDRQTVATWSYEPASRQWMRLHPSSGPPPLSNPSVCYDAGNDLVVLYGARQSAGAWRTETWVFDASRNGWFEVAVSSSPDAIGLIEYDPKARCVVGVRAHPGQALTLRIGPR